MWSLDGGGACWLGTVPATLAPRGGRNGDRQVCMCIYCTHVEKVVLINNGLAPRCEPDAPAGKTFFRPA